MTVWEIATLAAAPFVGSFLGLVADRLPEGRGVVLGRSCCDACGAALAARDLAPVLSFAVAGGRARCCGARLRPFLPLIELAALGVAIWSVAATDGPLTPLTAALGWMLLTLSVIDARTMLLPDALTLPLLAAGLAAAAGGAMGPPAAHALGAAAGYAAPRAVALIYRRLRGVEGMGGGDAKLLAAGGAWVGLAGLPGVMLIACAAGLAWAAVAARRGAGWRDPVPFGPALALGIWLTWLLGPLVAVAPT